MAATYIFLGYFTQLGTFLSKKGGRSHRFCAQVVLCLCSTVNKVSNALTIHSVYSQRKEQREDKHYCRYDRHENTHV